jgi:dihydropyrimidine dehydrogenase (NAD+) subunit PreA
MAVTDPILGTTVNGFALTNPFLLASAPPTASYELIRRAFVQGWGGVVTKTIKPDSMSVSDVSPRFHVLKDGAGAVVGFENIELVSKKDEAYWEKTIADLKAEFPDRMVIASLMGDNHPATWRNLARKMEAAGADALELNFSCPHGMPEKGVGAAIGQDPAITAEITGWVKSVARTPVIVKLTPNVTDIRVTGRAAVDAGADALAAINTVESITGVDLDTMQPFPLVGGGQSTYGGYSGAGIKPLGLKAVARLASANLGVPIYGMGGIRTWSDAAEYLALGASCVQVCTEAMVNGFGIVHGFNKGLAEFLGAKGYAGPEAIRGLALAKLSRHEHLQRHTLTQAMVTNADACVVCGKCLVACRDGGYQAITIRNKQVVIDLDKCDGCSLCSHVCPHGVLSMEQLTPVL